MALPQGTRLTGTQRGSISIRHAVVPPLCSSQAPGTSIALPTAFIVRRLQQEEATHIHLHPVCYAYSLGTAQEHTHAHRKVTKNSLGKRVIQSRAKQ